jgi:transposase
VERIGGRRSLQVLEPIDHALGRSRGGFGTKVHLVCDGRGLILAISVTAGQAHESRSFAPTMVRRLPHGGRWPDHLAGDKGYSYAGIRRWCRRRRIEPVIPARKDQPRAARFDRGRYRRRNVVERVIGWYKEYRALGTRHEKLAVNYVALWLIAIIEKGLKQLFPDCTSVLLSCFETDPRSWLIDVYHQPAPRLASTRITIGSRITSLPGVGDQCQPFWPPRLPAPATCTAARARTRRYR